MHNPTITGVISFCSNDFRFLRYCIDGIRPFCASILITVCDRFFDGSLENYALLEEVYSTFADCRFIEFPFDPNTTFRPFSLLDPDHPHFRHEWHNTGRWIAYFEDAHKSDYLLFLDADEIVYSPGFKRWLQTGELNSLTAGRFASYWHFRQAHFEAEKQQDVGLIVKRDALNPDDLWNTDERCGVWERMAGLKKLQIRGGDGLPFLHHYTGVRTKEEMLKKCKTWGHFWEGPWEELIEKDYQTAFQGIDYMRGHTYAVTSPRFDPLQVDVPILAPITKEEHANRLHRYPNVVIVNKLEMSRRALQHEFL